MEEKFILMQTMFLTCHDCACEIWYAYPLRSTASTAPLESPPFAHSYHIRYPIPILWKFSYSIRQPGFHAKLIVWVEILQSCMPKKVWKTWWCNCSNFVRSNGSLIVWTHYQPFYQSSEIYILNINIIYYMIYSNVHGIFCVISLILIFIKSVEFCCIR